MSSTPNMATTSSSFEAIMDAALANYTKQTGKDLRNHPLALKINQCDSAESILAIFHEQAQEFDEFRNGNSKLIKWLQPIVTGLYTLSNSSALREGVNLVSPLGAAIFSGISVLLSTARSVRESYDALVEIFECVEGFLRRLMIYTKIERLPFAMVEVVIKIMAEVISVLALATKQINQGLFKKYARKLLGNNEIKAVLQRLDRLTIEESMEAVTQTLDVVYGLVKNIEVIMEDGKASIGAIRQALILLQEAAMNVKKKEYDELQEKFRRWLSAPDPWTNHNIAREAHHRDTSEWFTQGIIMKNWKSTGSLLWVNGLPGSGKTIISSSIIEDVRDRCRTGLATLAFFYCDFRDTTKQNSRNFLESILTQFCHQSHVFSEVLSSVYSAHGDGSQQPSLGTLLGCLKVMLELQGQGILYIILDALDECPNSSGIPTRRQQVLKVVKELTMLKLPHLCFCVTSRPEVDIREVLEPLNPYTVSLQNQVGQSRDLVQYVQSIVHSDTTMGKWPEEVKKSVIDILAKNAAGMFRWAYCQLETLRRCPVRKTSRVLKELPKTLDETYERILQGIDEEKRDDAHRILQWLTVSSRPLHIEELAEAFAIDFDAETSGIPNFEPSWREPNAETAVLSACSTLVTVVNVGGKKVVQFSHFSVREYLTCDRIANSAPHSPFHVLLKPAHTLLAKACLSVLIRLNYSIDKIKIRDFPLARYAAAHWVDHALFEDVSSDIRDGLDCLFDRNRPHLAAWLWLSDIDDVNRRRRRSPPRPEYPDAVPLYYAALCGIRDLTERLVAAHPQDINALGGSRGAPLNAALYSGHLNIALFLLERGANGENVGMADQTPLYMASSRGYAEVVWTLLDRGADPKAKCNALDEYWRHVQWTPLLVALEKGRLEIARMLLERGADVNYTDNRGWSPLHIAGRLPSIDLVRLLLEHGANIDASDTWRGETALHDASSKGHITVIKLLLEHGANVDARSKSRRTPLHCATIMGHRKIVELLLDHGADVNAQKEDGWTALHLAAFNGHLKILVVLLKHGADPHTQTNEGKTPIQLAKTPFQSRQSHTQIMRLLSEHTSGSEWGLRSQA